MKKMVKARGRITDRQYDVKIDVKDTKILSILAENSRLAASEIAKKVQLSRDAVAYRIKRLQEGEVILGCVPVINFAALGLSEFHVFFLLDENNRAEQQGLITYLVEHEHTRSVMKYTDTWDLEWVLVARNLNEFERIVTDVATKFHHVILEKDQLAVIEKYFSHTYPQQYTHTVASADLVSIDDTDRSLLALLAQDCRQSSYELGRALCMSPDAALYRIKRLMSTGVITRFTTVINLSALKNSWYTYAIRFRKFDQKDQATFLEFARSQHQVIRAAKLFGPWQAMLSIVASSPESYHKIVKETKNAFAHIIFKYQTWLAHEELCYVAVPKVLLLKQK